MPNIDDDRQGQRLEEITKDTTKTATQTNQTSTHTKETVDTIHANMENELNYETKQTVKQKESIEEGHEDKAKETPPQQ